jgi:two-component system C4-dicarboxylate transport sensor histidine kinase DctB
MTENSTKLTRKQALGGGGGEGQVARTVRNGIGLAFVAAVVLAGVYAVAVDRARNEYLTSAHATAYLYVQTLRAEIDRRRHIPQILATDNDLAPVALGADPTELNHRLEILAKATESEALYLLDRSGLTVAASNWNDPVTFLHENYQFRSYFESARKGKAGQIFAIGATTGRPGAFISHSVTSDTGEVVGVLAVKIDFDPLIKLWSRSAQEVLLTNADGVVILAGREEWRYRATQPLNQEQLDRIARNRQFANRSLTPLDIGDVGASQVEIEGVEYLKADAPVGWLNWRLYLMTPRASIDRQAWSMVAYAAVGLLGLLAILLLMRSARIRSALQVSQRERVELGLLNSALNREIEERRAAEAELREAQHQLQRAAKLAALGQLAASVTHELGQPLSAMKTYVRTAQRELARGEPTSSATMERLDRLVERMIAISQQLKFFARRSGEPVIPMDLRDAVAGAIETLEPAIEDAGARLVRRLPEQPVVVNGGRRRLEQVLVNLLRNALDAMRAVPEPLIEIELTAEAGEARLVVRDIGEGIADSLAGSLFEPFSTTRASGEGMGLGLAISASIAHEHGGSIQASNRAEGGAEFVVILPLASAGAPEQNGA